MRRPQEFTRDDLPAGMPPGSFHEDGKRHSGDYGGRSYMIDGPRCAYFVPEYLSGSDYSGGLVERSNFRVFLENFGSIPGVVELSGGHGTFGVAIRLDTLARPVREGSKRAEMLEALRDLEGYPVLDEDDLSNLEMEREFEDWKSYGADDFRRELSALSAFVFNLPQEISDELDFSGVSDDDAFAVYRELCEIYGCSPEPETGGSFFFPTPGENRYSRSDDLFDASRMSSEWSDKAFHEVLSPLIAEAAKAGGILKEFREYVAATESEAREMGRRVRDTARDPGASPRFVAEAAAGVASAARVALAFGAKPNGI